MSPAFFYFLGDLILYHRPRAVAASFLLRLLPNRSTFQAILGDLYASSVANPSLP